MRTISPLSSIEQNTKKSASIRACAPTDVCSTVTARNLKTLRTPKRMHSTSMYGLSKL